jgi:hypothetical protein
LKQRTVELQQFLAWDVGEHGSPFAFDHQVPHRRHRRLATTLVGKLRIIRDKVKLSAAVTEATLLNFMAAHGELSLMGYSSGTARGRAAEM